MSPLKTQQTVMNKPIRIILCIGAKSELFGARCEIDPAPRIASLTPILLRSFTYHKTRDEPKAAEQFGSRLIVHAWASRQSHGIKADDVVEGMRIKLFKRCHSDQLLQGSDSASTDGEGRVD
jgi:hypothetical protein